MHLTNHHLEREGSQRLAIHRGLQRVPVIYFAHLKRFVLLERGTVISIQNRYEQRWVGCICGIADIKTNASNCFLWSKLPIKLHAGWWYIDFDYMRTFSIRLPIGCDLQWQKRKVLYISIDHVTNSMIQLCARHYPCCLRRDILRRVHTKREVGKWEFLCLLECVYESRGKIIWMQWGIRLSSLFSRIAHVFNRIH